MTRYNSRNLVSNARMEAKSIDPVTVTTTANYVEVIDLDVREYAETIVTLSNLDVTNAIDYKIEVANEYENGEKMTPWSNVLSAGDVDEAILVRHARLFISVKSTVPGLAVKIDIISGR